MSENVKNPDETVKNMETFNGYGYVEHINFYVCEETDEGKWMEKKNENVAIWNM